MHIIGAGPIFLTEHGKNDYISAAQKEGLVIHQGAPIYLEIDSDRVLFTEFYRRVVESRTYEPDTSGKIEVLLDNSTIRVASSSPIPIRGVNIFLERSEISHTFEIESNSVAELLLQGLGTDRIIWDRDLRTSLDQDSATSQ